jgi:hypothetical protein
MVGYQGRINLTIEFDHRPRITIPLFSNSNRTLFNNEIFIRVFAGGHRFPPLRPLAFLAKKVAFGVGSHVFGMSLPTVTSAECWATKNTMLAAQTLLLAATAAGLSTCPMEGFDGRKVRRALRIPRRYSVSLVVAVGYPSPLATSDPIRTRRFPSAQVVFGDYFGDALVANSAA